MVDAPTPCQRGTVEGFGNQGPVNPGDKRGWPTPALASFTILLEPAQSTSARHKASTGITSMACCRPMARKSFRKLLPSRQPPAGAMRKIVAKLAGNHWPEGKRPECTWPEK